MRLNDLIVSKDKYGMTLTYALHRAFNDLGPRMIEHWHLFLNADFVLADGSLRTVMDYLARGARIVASPSYCAVAEEVIPELRKIDRNFDITNFAPRTRASYSPTSSQRNSGQNGQSSSFSHAVHRSILLVRG